jgi:hypothetical protein
MTKNKLNAPWHLRFDRDGTEDVATILDRHGHALATSRHFWLPEGSDPKPPTLAGMQAMAAAPQMLKACKLALATLRKQGGENGREIRALRIAIAVASGHKCDTEGNRIHERDIPY